MESHIERFGRMDGQPLVSIVVLNCNGANWLPKCFESIKAQTILGQIETVMVDNHSTDDSVAVARQLLADFPSPASCAIRKTSAFAKATIPAPARHGRADYFCS
jgi:glycosyltransferase involved in cell wall biosynthesis